MRVVAGSGQLDFGRLNDQALDFEAFGKGLNFEIPFIHAGCFTELGNLLARLGKRGGLKLFEFLAGIGVEEADVAVAAGGGEGFAIGTEGKGVDAAISHIELG